MTEITTFVGLDVHEESISVAVAMRDGEPWSQRNIGNRPEAISKLVKRWGAAGTRYAYEAGPCGYVLYRQLRSLGAECIVAAPSKMERAPGDQVKTDRRDALKLVWQLRAGLLARHAVWVPDPGEEAFRDLTRARQTAQGDLQRVRNRITSLLLRLGVRPPSGSKAWSAGYRAWLAKVQLDSALQQIVLKELSQQLGEAEARVDRLNQEVEKAAESAPRTDLLAAYTGMRGIATVIATSLVSELGDVSRFESPRQLMSYVGYAVQEDSSGGRIRRGHITRAGNAHIRHLLGQMAWNQAKPVKIGKTLQRQRAGLAPEILELIQRADQRLHRRYHRLIRRGKATQVAAIAVARESLGFIWAIARLVDGLPVAPPRTRRALA